MTLSRLHIRFPTCVVVPLGLDVDLCIETLWVSILYRIPRLWEYLWFCDLISCFGTWDYLLSVVGVGHLGSTRSGGSAFYSYHWDPSVVIVVGASLSTFPFILSMYHYDGWLYFMMDGYIMYGGWFHLFYCTCIMDSMRMMYLYFYICIFF